MRYADDAALGRGALCVFFAVFWALRLLVATFVFDMRPYLTSTARRVGVTNLEWVSRTGQSSSLPNASATRDVIASGTWAMHRLSPDGHRVAVIMMVSYRVEGGTFIPGKPEPWSKERFQTAGNVRRFDLHPDGERFLMARAPQQREAPRQDRLVFVFNFFEELKRHFPQ